MSILSTDSEEGLREISLHPPHMTDSKGRLLPAALIPFCAYQTNVLGLLSPDLPFISCSLALPTVLDGQLCYSINASNIAKGETKSGRDNGLLMLLDVGPTKPQENKNREDEKKKVYKKGKSVDIDISNRDKTSARVYLQTLSGFSSFGEGDYAMSALTKMTGRKSFLEFPDSLKKCQIESMDKCRISEYFETVQDQCGCVPWSLIDFKAVSSEVGKVSNTIQ